MLKKIMFSLLSLLVMYSTAVVGYRIFEPVSSYYMGDEHTYLDYGSLKDYLASTGNGSVHYLFFYSMIDPDSVYIKNSVITSVEKSTSLQFAKIIETVDITDLDSSMQTAKLSADWGISNYPAFAAVVVEDGIPVIINKLEDTEDKPITDTNVINWLAENDLYTIKKEY